MTRDPSELKIGDIFQERYEVRGQLGFGDRKRTYLALDTKMDREVALSVVRPDANPADPEATEREAKVLGRIGSNDNIVSLYDYEVGTTPEYMVFEYLSGGTLAERLQATGPQSLEAVLRLGRQVGRGLAHLHGQGLIHRDISPANIWLDGRGEAHLGDFDSAISVDDSTKRPPPTTSSFASPEELSGGALDERSDLFSLGGVLFAVAMGTDGPGDIGLLRSQRGDIPTSFAELVEGLLQEDPNNRPEHIDSVLASLEAIRHATTLHSLIAQGEGDSLEFKESLHECGEDLRAEDLPLDLRGRVLNEKENFTLDQARNELRKRLNWEVTKTIAAFLNTGGGTLLVGVSDTGETVGIEPDFKYVHNLNSDGWLLSLQEVVLHALDPDVWGVVRVSLVRDGDRTVAVISCPPRSVETWHPMKDEKRGTTWEAFYIRMAAGSQELQGQALTRYVRERWPS